MKVIWAPLAEEQAADAFFSALPDQGRMVPEAQRPSLREVFVEPYRVIYHRDEDVLVILSVQHERRDLDIEGIEP